ncbi:transketolase family protein [Streptomyces sp. NPDC003393]
MPRGSPSTGKIPVVSTFAAFASMRAHEQVRSDIGYVNLPVKIIATVGGLTAGQMGPTHQGIEDLAVMRAIPNMTVIAPGDPQQVARFVELAIEHPGPVYIRLGRGEDPVIYPEDQPLEIGKVIIAREGTDAAIIACGTMMHDALEAARRLETEGISARVIGMHTIKPLDRVAVIDAAREIGRIVTVEDHFRVGGLGSAVAEVVTDEGITIEMVRLGVPDAFGLIGSSNELYHYYGYDADGIQTSVKSLLGHVTV